MTTDAWLAIAHHIAVFALLGVIASEWSMLRPGLLAADVRRLALVDAAYGALAATVLTVGILRLWLGAKPFDFYSDNPFFWLKMAAFATVGLLSITPTVRYLRWRKALEEDPSATPTAGEIAGARRYLLLEVGVFAIIPVAAALMARGIGS